MDLPPNWKIDRDDEGKWYYYNEEIDVTTWNQPTMTPGPVLSAPLELVLLVLKDWFELDDTFVQILQTIPEKPYPKESVFPEMLITKPGPSEGSFEKPASSNLKKTMKN